MSNFKSKTLTWNISYILTIATSLLILKFDRTNASLGPIQEARCLSCIRNVTSLLNIDTSKRCEGYYCGPYQISYTYWAEAGKPGNNQNARDYEKCVRDKSCAERTVKGYFEKFKRDCNNDGVIDCRDMSALHKAGTTSCASDWFYKSRYWVAFNKTSCMTNPDETVESLKRELEEQNQPRPQKKNQTLTTECLDCICDAISGCNTSANNCGSGTVCGPFAISQSYWKDARRPGASWTACTRNKECSSVTVKNYMEKNIRDCNGDGYITCEDYAAIHRRGPRGCSNSDLFKDHYWNKFLSCRANQKPVKDVNMVKVNEDADESTKTTSPLTSPLDSSLSLADGRTSPLPTNSDTIRITQQDPRLYTSRDQPVTQLASTQTSAHPTISVIVDRKVETESPRPVSSYPEKVTEYQTTNAEYSTSSQFIGQTTRAQMIIPFATTNVDFPQPKQTIKTFDQPQTNEPTVGSQEPHLTTPEYSFTGYSSHSNEFDRINSFDRVVSNIVGSPDFSKSYPPLPEILMQGKQNQDDQKMNELTSAVKQQVVRPSSTSTRPRSSFTPANILKTVTSNESNQVNPVKPSSISLETGGLPSAQSQSTSAKINENIIPQVSLAEPINRKQPIRIDELQYEASSLIGNDSINLSSLFEGGLNDSSRISNECLECICDASSNCDTSVQCISKQRDKNRCGLYMISWNQYQESDISLTFLNPTPSNMDELAEEKMYYECTTDRLCAEKLIHLYIEKHIKDCNNDGKIDCHDIAAIHRVGPNNCNSGKFLGSQYWKDFNICYSTDRLTNTPTTPQSTRAI